MYLCYYPRGQIALGFFVPLGQDLLLGREDVKMGVQGQRQNIHHEKLARLVRIAMMGAMGFMLMYFGEIRIPFFADFLKYDPGDIPAMITTFTMGPAAGVAVQGVKVVLFWISGKTTTGLVGVLANFFAGASLALTAGVVHWMVDRLGRRSLVWDTVAIICGTAAMALVMIPINALLIYPAWGMQGAAAWQGALLISTPFNIFKGLFSSGLSLAFYRKLEPFLVGEAVRRTA